MPFHAWLRQLAADRLTDVYRRHLADKRNVAREHPDVVAELREIFEIHLAEEAATKGTQPGVVDPEMKLRLKALGYL